MEDFAIKISLDTTALDRLAGMIEQLAAAFDSFAEGASQSMQGAADTISGETVNALEQAKSKTAELGATADGASKQMMALGKQWGGFIGGIVAKLTGGALAGLSVNSLLGGYTKGVGEVAKMTWFYSEKVDEWRKKRALLARVNREDLELYRKGRRALTDFNIAMGNLSTVVGRALAPVMRNSAEGLEKLSNWMNTHSGDILRFLEVLAGVITAALIPSLSKLALKALANPFTLFVTGVTAAALAIDDLIVYCKGGEAAFGRFWARFGTGPELAAKFTAAFNTVKETALRVKDALSEMWNTFSLGERAGAMFEALGDALSAVWGLVSRLLSAFADLWTLLGGGSELGAEIGNAFDAVALALNGVAWAARKIAEAWDYLTGKTGDIIGDMRAAWQSFGDWLLGFWTGLVDKISGWINGIISPFKSIYNKVFGGGGEVDNGSGGTTATAATEAAPIPAALDSVAGAADMYDRLNTVAKTYNSPRTDTQNNYTQSDNRTLNVYVKDAEEAELIVKAPSFLDNDFMLAENSAW